MSWFHHTKLDTIRSDREHRRALAERIRNDIFREEFYATNIKQIEATIRDAKREDETYADALGEPMPEQMRKAVELEVLMWMAIHDLLFKPPVTEDQYPTLCRKLRPFIAVLIDLLHAEEEMTSSPLVQHYLNMIDAWHDQAKVHL